MPVVMINYFKYYDIQCINLGNLLMWETIICYPLKISKIANKDNLNKFKSYNFITV